MILRIKGIVIIARTVVADYVLDHVAFSAWDGHGFNTHALLLMSAGMDIVGVRFASSLTVVTSSWSNLFAESISNGSV